MARLARPERQSWSSRQREGKAPVVRPANCCATRYGCTWIESQTTQLGLRFAAAKLPGLLISAGVAAAGTWGLGEGCLCRGGYA